MKRIVVRTPQFTREADDPKPASPPWDRAAWDALSTLDAKALREMGLRYWNISSEGKKLFLFPGEWYSKIPKGFPIVNIFWEESKFIPGKTDDDIRFGCLSFGILVGK